MNLNHLRLYLNLFAAPGICVFGGAAARFVGREFAAMPMLAGLVSLTSLVSTAAFLVAMAFFARSCWRLYQAEAGIGEACHSCGSPVAYVDDGRYGPYFKCLACSTNRAAR
jgi:hypothetical protein